MLAPGSTGSETPGPGGGSFPAVEEAGFSVVAGTDELAWEEPTQNRTPHAKQIRF